MSRCSVLLIDCHIFQKPAESVGNVDQLFMINWYWNILQKPGESAGNVDQLIDDDLSKVSWTWLSF